MLQYLFFELNFVIKWRPFRGRISERHWRWLIAFRWKAPTASVHTYPTIVERIPYEARKKKKKKRWVYTESENNCPVKYLLFQSFSMTESVMQYSSYCERRVYVSLSCILFSFRMKCSFHQFHYENIHTLFQWNYFIIEDLIFFSTFFSLNKASCCHRSRFYRNYKIKWNYRIEIMIIFNSMRWIWRCMNTL